LRAVKRFNTFYWVEIVWVRAGSSLAQKLVEELEADEKTRKRLAKLLVSEAVSESELRLAIINAVLRNVATEEDIANHVVVQL